MLKLTKGHTVSKPELLEEGYMISGDVTIVANVDANKIKDVLRHFIAMHEEAMFFILELPVTRDREEEFSPGVVGDTHKDIYYIDGCSQDECLLHLERNGELLINDGISSFGFGGHESQNEIMVGHYNVLTIYSQNLNDFEGFYEMHEIEKKEDIVTAWDTFTKDTPGQSFRYEVEGKTVYDIPDLLKDWNIYLAETRVE